MPLDLEYSAFYFLMTAFSRKNNTKHTGISWHEEEIFFQILKGIPDQIPLLLFIINYFQKIIWPSDPQIFAAEFSIISALHEKSTRPLGQEQNLMEKTFIQT